MQSVTVLIMSICQYTLNYHISTIVLTWLTCYVFAFFFGWVECCLLFCLCNGWLIINRF